MILLGQYLKPILIVSHPAFCAIPPLLKAEVVCRNTLGIYAVSTAASGVRLGLYHSSFLCPLGQMRIDMV